MIRLTANFIAFVKHKNVKLDLQKTKAVLDFSGLEKLSSRRGIPFRYIM